MFDFFEILIVLVIVTFDLFSSNESFSLADLFFFESKLDNPVWFDGLDGLDGISHAPYKDDNLYCSIIFFGDNPISHEIVT